MKTLIIALLFIPSLVLGQADEPFSLANSINKLYRDSSCNFYFNLNQIPPPIWKSILNVKDSMDKVIYKEKGKSKLKDFIANPYEAYNGTDVITKDRPSRRFIYGINKGTKWVLTYEHGGIGHHYHVIYLDTNDARRLTASTSLQNSDILRDLIWDKRIDQIKNRPFESIVSEDDFHLLNGRLLKNYDVF